MLLNTFQNQASNFILGLQKLSFDDEKNHSPHFIADSTNGIVWAIDTNDSWGSY